MVALVIKHYPAPCLPMHPTAHAPCNPCPLQPTHPCGRDEDQLFHTLLNDRGINEELLPSMQVSCGGSVVVRTSLSHGCAGGLSDTLGGREMLIGQAEVQLWRRCGIATGSLPPQLGLLKGMMGKEKGHRRWLRSQYNGESHAPRSQ